MNRSQKKTLLTLVVVVAALAAVLLIVRTLKDRSARQAEEEAAAAEAAGVITEEAAYSALSYDNGTTALSFALDDLRAADAAAYARVCGALSGRTRDALCARSAFWEPYRGARAAAAAVSVNEGYLFSIGAQESGTAAYGEFVERMLGND